MNAHALPVVVPEAASQIYEAGMFIGVLGT
jgi:hypothetical protein